jgi:hypothetical protein
MLLIFQANTKSLETSQQFIKNVERMIPNIVQKKGIFFSQAFKNSASTRLYSKLLFSILLPNIVEPTPMTRSEDRNPQNVAPSDKNSKGRTINIGPSCIVSMYFL